MPTITAARTEVSELAEAVERLTSWVRRNAPRGEFSAVAMAVLDTISREGALRITDLAARERITQPGMTTVASRLEEAGMAERYSDPTDGRATLVDITDAGRDLLAARHAARAEALIDPINSLTKQQQRDLFKAIDSLNALSRSTA
jgi:DNA-binding MarR family transcriptional regulator